MYFLSPQSLVSYKHLLSVLWAVWVEQLLPYLIFLSRPYRRKSNVPYVPSILSQLRVYGTRTREPGSVLGNFEFDPYSFIYSGSQVQHWLNIDGTYGTNAKEQLVSYCPNLCTVVLWLFKDIKA